MEDTSKIDQNKDKPKDALKKSYKVPRFKSKIIKHSENLENQLPKVDPGIFKYYELEKSNTNVMDMKPYIIYLNENEVKNASRKEKSEIIKSVGGLCLKIIIAVIILAIICFSAKIIINSIKN